MKKIFIFSFLVAFVVLTINLTTSISSKSKIHPLTHSWEKAVPFQGIPEGLASLKSKDCGTCHQEYYKEWLTSTHAHAWTDVQFQAEIRKESSPYMCINCHIPLENQQEYLIKGLVNGDIYQPVKEKNEHFDKALQDEGINCVSCHVRNNAIIGVKGLRAPHKVVKDPEFLSESLCIGCHNANYKINKELVCTFETGDEWKVGPYNGKKNCISCHMQTIDRELVKGFGHKKSHFHNFPGSGIPKVKGETVAMLLGFGFYPSKISDFYFKGDTINFYFKVKNEFAGHKVPTGDPERFFTFEFKIFDSENNIVFEKEDRIGEEWEWYPEAKKLSDTNLPPREERTFSIKYPLLKKGKYHLEILAKKHRMTLKDVQYNKLGDNYPISREVYKKEFPFSVR